MSFQIEPNPDVRGHWQPLHRLSEVHAHRAELHLREGRPSPAQEEYERAAQFEMEALARVKGLPRTRGLLAISAAALWHKGGHADKAEQLARQELAGIDVPVFALESLREFLSTGK